MAEALAKTERAAYKAHIKALEETTAWQRTLLERFMGVASSPVVAPPDVLMESRLSVSEEEEDIQDMLDAGLIDHEEARGMLEAAGALSTEIEFATA